MRVSTRPLSFQTIQSGIENLDCVFLVNWIGFRHKISLELRVKTKYSCYPEKMSFDTLLGYPCSTIEFLHYHASPGLVDTSVPRFHDGYHDQMFNGFL